MTKPLEPMTMRTIHICPTHNILLEGTAEINAHYKQYHKKLVEIIQ